MSFSIVKESVYLMMSKQAREDIKKKHKFIITNEFTGKTLSHLIKELRTKAEELKKKAGVVK